jgi:hypothetical protein
MVGLHLGAWVMMLKVHSRDDVRVCCYCCHGGGAWVSAASGQLGSEFWLGKGGVRAGLARDIHIHSFCVTHYRICALHSALCVSQHMGSCHDDDHFKCT